MMRFAAFADCLTQVITGQVLDAISARALCRNMKRLAVQFSTLLLPSGRYAAAFLLVVISACGHFMSAEVFKLISDGVFAELHDAAAAAANAAGDVVGVAGF